MYVRRAGARTTVVSPLPLVVMSSANSFVDTISTWSCELTKLLRMGMNSSRAVNW